MDTAPVAPVPDPPGFYGRLARFAIRRRGWVVGFVALVTVVAGVFAARLRVDSDILSLMPKDLPAVAALHRLDEEEGGATVITVAVEGEDPAARDAWMDTVADRLRALPETEYVLWRLEPGLARRVGLVNVARADLETLRDRVRSAISLGPAAANPFIAARLFDLGPLAAKLEQGAASGGRVLGERDGVVTMLVRPKGSAHDLPYARAYMAAFHRVLEEADAPKAGVRVLWVGGGYRHNVEDYEGVVSDLGWVTSASAVLVLLILTAAFRTPRAVAILFVPLLVSNVWTLGVAGATIGALNTFTSFSNAILFGLGVEFGVHLYARFREQRAEGHDVEEAVVRAWDLVGGACTSAALTSSAGFAALMAANFAGFQQLGWLLFLGLLACLAVVLVLTPILLVAMERSVARPSHRRGIGRRRRPSTYRLAPVALALIACITLVCTLLVRRTRIEYDMSELRRDGLAWNDLDERQRTFVRESFSPAIVSYPDAAALDAGIARVQARIATGRFPEIARVISVRDVIPVDQSERLAVLDELARLASDPAVAYLPAPVQTTLRDLAADPARELRIEDLPPGLQHVLGVRDGHHRMFLVPSGNMWDMRESAKLLDAIDRELPGANVAGEHMILGTLLRMMKRDAPIVGGIALVLVIFFTALDLRRLRATVGAMLVLGAGAAWWGALLVLSDIRLSVVNVVGIPIVLGIGIDVMIHLIHRLEQEGPGSILKSLTTTGWASALGTSTTVVAFAALSLASSNGVRSLGLLVLLGESAVTVAGFVLVPLWFATAWRLQGRAPAALAREASEASPPESSAG
jgi:hypothetical protein